MLPTTLNLIKAALRTDPYVTEAEHVRVCALLRPPKSRPTTKPTVSGETRLVRRAEAARRLGGSLRLVDRLAQQGLLRKHRLPGRQRAQGILEADLLALLGS